MYEAPEFWILIRSICSSFFGQLGHFVKHHKDLNSLIKYHTSPVPYILPIKYFFCQHAMPLFCFMFRIKVFIVIVCD